MNQGVSLPKLPEGPHQISVCGAYLQDWDPQVSSHKTDGEEENFPHNLYPSG